MKFDSDKLRRLPAFAAAPLLFLLIAVLYFAPQFSDEVLPQSDVAQYRGMTADIEAAREATGQDPQWTGGMFGGMPAYLINTAYPAQIVKSTVGRITGLVPEPAGFVFFAMLSMWLMLLLAGVDPRVAAVPAIAYGLSTYFPLIIGAGHITKMRALVYAPLMIGGIYCTLRRNKWAGGALAALAMSLEIGANHPQITYYFMLAAAIFWISECIAAVRGRRLRDFAVRTAVLAAAGVLAAGSNFAPLWYTAKHTPDTVRGGSELAAESGSPGGLDLDYATAWSYGRSESLNLLIPDFAGGDSARGLSADGPAADALADYGLESLAPQLPAYWGPQPYTAGPTYLGASVIMLAVFGLAVASRRSRAWMIAAAVLMLFLAWGRHMMWFTELAFSWLPGYDKFRTVSMTLVVVQWIVPLAGAIGLMKLWQGALPPRKALRALAWSAGAVCGLCLLLALFGRSMFGFGFDESAAMLTDQFGDMLARLGYQDDLARGLHEQIGISVASGMAAERFSIMQADALRSLLFAAAAVALLLLFAMGKIRRGAAVAAIAAVVLADLVPVDMRYLSYDSFASPRRMRMTPDAADARIAADTDPGFRVLNLAVSPYNDASTSLFHRSVGGYHGAKLSRYQDIIDRYINERALRRGDSDAERILDILNVRYLKLSSDSIVRRPTALGAAWFADNVIRTSGAGDEITMLSVADLSHTAVVDDRFRVDGDDFGSGTIALTEYSPAYLRYEYEADAPALAIFSEIYYDKGWRAFVDGREAPYIRADYILRAMELPAGSHIVEWRFRSPSWRAVEGVTLVCSLAVLAAAAAALIFIWRRRRSETETEES
ncbi:MAG: hypothetical protein J1D86_04025 [Alistipes sp.]|nr:hypothetical protein [Alistipes sp.]